MSFYVIFIIVIIFLLGDYRIGNLKKPQFFTLLGILTVTSVLAFRFDIGADYSQYYTNFFKAYQRDQTLNYEPLNNLLFLITTPFGEPWIPIALYGIFTVGIACYSIKKESDNFFIGTFTFLSIFYLFAFSTMRQGLASVIVLSAYSFLRDNKLRSYYLRILIAGLFHYSAFISVFFPYIYKLKPKYLIFALIFSTIIFIGGGSFLSKIPFIGKYAIYLNVASNFGGGNFQRLFLWGILIILWILRSKTNSNTTHLLVLCSFGAIFPAIFGTHIGGRIAQYMYIFLCIAAPNILNNKTMLIKSAYIALLLTWFFAYVYIADDNGSKTFLPYQTIFEVDANTMRFK